MKRIVNLSVVFSLVFLFSYNCGLEAKTTNKITLRYPSNITREINFNLNPCQPAQKFIHFQVKNPKRKKLLVWLDLDLYGAAELREAINYRIQDNKPKKKNKDWYHIRSKPQVRKNPFVIDKNYNGWIKVNFAGLEEWWQIEAGDYRGELEIRVKEIDE